MKKNLWVLPVFISSLLWAGQLGSKGEVTLESRVFENDHNSATVDEGYGFRARLETGMRSGGFKWHIRAMGRVDEKDPDRQRVLIEEAWISYRKGNWYTTAGYQMLNWTATEAFHPADLMNSRNLDSDLENPEKRGELMVSIKRRFAWGNATAYWMPRFEKPQWVTSSSRLNILPSGYQIGTPIWVEDGGGVSPTAWHPQWGLRWSQTLGDADFSIHWVDHIDRQSPTVLSFAAGTLSPVYHQVRDLGLTYSQVIGALIFKLEESDRDFATPSEIQGQVDHRVWAWGLEYGLAHNSGAETTWLLEGEVIDGVNKETRLRLSPFQNDILVGVRHARNDVMGREILITWITDLEENHQNLVNLSYRQRLSDVWHAKVGLRMIDAPLPDVQPNMPTGLQVLDHSNQIYMNLSRYF